MLNFYEIRRKCLATGQLYKDPEFQPSEKILMLEDKQKVSQWCRPKEICANPKFVVDGFSRFDVMQGSLGDCWFLAALATLTQNKKLFEKVVPADNDFGASYAGVFHFRFWLHGQWTEIIVDDQLPVNQGQLVFIKAPKGEFWAALLEKAYAKLYGSYGAIAGGHATEAMVDFTGGVIERFSVIESPDHEHTTLFNIIKKAFERGSLVATSKQNSDESKGLFGRHAYTITKAHVIEMNRRLVRIVGIRNPWGNEVEWNGAFADHSSEWHQIPKELLSVLDIKFEDDGEFHMSFEDFMRFFNGIDICHWSADAFEMQDCTKIWSEEFYHGQWYRSSPFSPQIIVKLVDPDEDDNDDLCTLILSISTKHRRRMRLNPLSIKLEIFKLKAADVKNNFLKRDVLAKNKVGETKLEHFRDITTRLRLLPGNYAIVPSTASYEGGEFMLRVITEAAPKQKKVIVKINEVPTITQKMKYMQKSSFDLEATQSSSEPQRQRRHGIIACFSIFIGFITALTLILILVFILMLTLVPEETTNTVRRFLSDF